jgi:BirA family transcriptional regulator, biotin operon repressor / biotin---[acetyl-CoA-carboxylase] ligase
VTGSELPRGFRLLELGAVTSTNDVARRLADEGEPAGLFVVADRQTAGRGREGRAWRSPPGNLYASLLLRPSRPLAEAANLSLVAGLALAEAVGTLSGGSVEPRVKWPNDVQVDGAKLAGILLEGASDGRGGCLWLVVGIGVNVVSAPDGAAAAYPTTHLVACGLADATPRSLLLALAGTLRSHLDRWEAHGFAAAREAWLERAAAVGAAVELRLGDRLVQGRMADVDEGGALRLRLESGAVERFAAGEVVLA